MGLILRRQGLFTGFGAGSSSKGHCKKEDSERALFTQTRATRCEYVGNFFERRAARSGPETPPMTHLIFHFGPGSGFEEGGFFLYCGAFLAPGWP